MAALFSIGILVNIGMWFERLVIIVGSEAHEYDPYSWGVYKYPSIVEWGILVGSFSLFFFLFLLFAKFLPDYRDNGGKGGDTGSGQAKVRETSMAKKLAVVGIFAYLNELLSAMEGLKREKIRYRAVYSPMRKEEIREALGEPPLGPGRFFTLAGAILGILTGIFLAWYTSIQWHFIVGGKPPIPVIPTVIPAFEFFILIAVFFTLAGLLFHEQDAENAPSRPLRQALQPGPFRDFDSLHGWTICEPVSSLLEDLGAEEVRQD